MAQFFKKRRRGAPGPSKNELKVRRRRADANEAAQQRPLSEEIPGVQRVTLQLDFLTPQRQVLDQQTHVFNAADTADFTAECLGRCGGTGIFDLSDKVQQAVNARQRTLQSTDLARSGFSPAPARPAASNFNPPSTSFTPPPADPAGTA
ncbi:MAG: hypothetical protein IPP68_01770 [Elusimicrobia bacterium]|nr:hypothetical protein [Elusimicrobiota bacterium]